MEVKEILSKCDHTLLLPTATKDDIRYLCDDGIAYGVASVCIPPSYVKFAKEYTEGKLPICTVIGFPNGYSTTKVKLYEAKEALDDGADEIDRVINIGWLKEKNYDAILEEIKAIKALMKEKVLKVIIETCLLTDEEKEKMCEIVTESGADYIKTSTGFSAFGATPHDIDVFKASTKGSLKIKAAGGITSFADAEEFIRRGADRLGTSRIVKLAKMDKSKNK